MTYSIAAVSILMIAGSVLVLAGVPVKRLLGLGSLFIPPHIYRQLRGGYRLKRFSAAWRALVLTIFASIALGLFALGLLMLGALG